MTDPPDRAGLTGAPLAPAGAEIVFGDRLPVLIAYGELLAGPGVRRGLLGPKETARLWERHLLNCAGLSELLTAGQVVLDLGSGAGLPGLVLAICRPDITVVLLEPLLRRATFLTEAVEQLALSSVVIRRGRAEDLAGRLLVDVVTARAVAPLNRLAGWAMPLLHPGGRLLALKGERADQELAQCGAAVLRAGGSNPAVVEVGSAKLGTQARVIVVERAAGSAVGGASRGPRAARSAGHRRGVGTGRR